MLTMLSLNFTAFENAISQLFFYDGKKEHAV